MKIRVFEGTVVITSGVSMELVDKASQYCPNALRVFEVVDGEDEQVFGVAHTQSDEGSISSYGIIYDRAGKVRITIPSDLETEDDIRNYIKHRVGRSVQYAQMIEADLPAAVEAAERQYDSLDDIIEIVG